MVHFMLRPLNQSFNKLINCIFRVEYLEKIMYHNHKPNIINNIMSKIKISGPITVAEYMKVVLTSPDLGYYMNRDVFGKEGDFITSPEISQLFGELVGIWCINEWQKLGSPKPMNIVEFGPGRGTMMKDILKVFKQLNVSDGVSIHMVEVSKELCEIQAATLTQKSEYVAGVGPGPYMKGISHCNLPIQWYYSIHDLPRTFSCVLAHEFFDALPIHKFKRTKEGWREVLIDIKSYEDNSFRFVLSRHPTPASLLLTKKEDMRNEFEVSLEARGIVEEMGKRLEEHGGFALIMDYGHSGEKQDTFRGFRKHQLHDPLEEPGCADLTADVNFAWLAESGGDYLVSVGPVSQAHFLTALHAELRLEILLKNCPSEELKESLKSGYHMLVDEDKMGERFKLMALYPTVLREYLQAFPPAGFSWKAPLPVSNQL